MAQDTPLKRHALFIMYPIIIIVITLSSLFLVIVPADITIRDDL